MIDGMRVEPVKGPASADLPVMAGIEHRDKGRGVKSFSEVLKLSVRKVNQLQIDADNLTNRLALGEVEDISEVSIAVEKAELALRMMVQIRDKMLDAYQQISRMSA
ncbi:MAG: flagellar hook-basal body complex protein FliE [Synergistaceae bacterium]|jgi:flagellar hook-basal body complex protein FliE|nr:flagellar hook-basal body complex protein FliE [Synergistaceae bacterium]